MIIRVIFFFYDVWVGYVSLAHVNDRVLRILHTNLMMVQQTLYLLIGQIQLLSLLNNLFQIHSRSPPTPNTLTTSNNSRRTYFTNLTLRCTTLHSLSFKFTNLPTKLIPIFL